MALKSIRILVEMTFPDAQVGRVWDGSGPYIDADGELWRGCAAVTGLDIIEQAINGEAWTLELGLTGVPSSIADLAWHSHEDDEVIGTVVRIMIQPCDEYDQPAGEPEVKFTGRIDNIRFDDRASDTEILSNIIVEVTNRFVLRRLSNGAVLSDADQRARSAALNPSGNPDKFCKRIPTLFDKTIVWPRWN